MEYPRIHLAIDNCFASKRWTLPSEWMEVISSLRVKYIEASADTECDPLYMGPDYLRDWVEEVQVQSEKKGLRVVNLYSGHGSYSTLGLSHTDIRVRDRFHHEWLESLILIAERLTAGIGFFCHAFNDSALQNNAAYSEIIADLYNRFSDLAIFAAEHNNVIIGVEQMYTPHQIPWTINGSIAMIKEVYT
ncbi:MAG: hypothetical protein HN368_13625, partial [Spirochaetales bacterium]|nr:hypothetical protein [Spirochaetales bacterium]